MGIAAAGLAAVATGAPVAQAASRPGVTARVIPSCSAITDKSLEATLKIHIAGAATEVEDDYVGLANVQGCDFYGNGPSPVVQLFFKSGVRLAKLKAFETNNNFDGTTGPIAGFGAGAFGYSSGGISFIAADRAAVLVMVQARASRARTDLLERDLLRSV